MPEKPLTYLSQKIFFFYLDANTRFQLAFRGRRNPQMQMIVKLEQSLPLNIDSLVLDLYKMKINNYTYEVGLYRKYFGATPKYVQRMNDGCEFKENQDQYGCIINPMEDGAIAENMKTLKVALNLQSHYGLGDKDHLERKLKFYSGLQEQFVKENGEGNCMVQKHIDDFELRLESVNRKMNGEIPPYEIFLQFVRTAESGKRKIQIMEYNGTLQDYQDSMVQSLFGGRKNNTVNVRRLEINYNSYIWNFPANLRFQVKDLKLDEGLNVGEVMESLNGFLDPKSFPLENVEFYFEGASSQELFAIPGIKETKALVVHNMPGGEYFSSHGVADGLVVKFEKSDVIPMTYYRIIEKWIEEGRQAGTHHSWELQKEDAVELFNNLRRNFKNQASGMYTPRTKMFKYISIPMSNGLHIHISCFKPRGINQKKWILKMRVPKVGDGF